MIALALVILAWLLVGCAFLYWDICEQCRLQARQDELDELWDDDGTPSAVTLEAVQATASAE